MWLLYPSLKKASEATFHDEIGQLFFQVFVKPVDKVAMPKNAVLGMEDPVGLIREIEIASIQATELGSIIGSHALRSNDTEVELTMDYADRRIPFINKKVGRVGV